MQMGVLASKCFFVISALEPSLLAQNGQLLPISALELRALNIFFYYFVPPNLLVRLWYLSEMIPVDMQGLCWALCGRAVSTEALQ